MSQNLFFKIAKKEWSGDYCLSPDGLVVNTGWDFANDCPRKFSSHKDISIVNKSQFIIPSTYTKNNTSNNQKTERTLAECLEIASQVVIYTQDTDKTNLVDEKS